MRVLDSVCASRALASIPDREVRMVRFDIVPGSSTVRVRATTTVNTVTMTTTDVLGHVDAETTAAGVFLAVAEPPGHLELRVDALHSGNWFYDREGLRRFDAAHYPLVAADLVGAIPLGGGAHRVTWLLTFHGATRQVSGELLAQHVDPDSILIEGEHDVDVRTWGLQPTGLLSIRVNPEAIFSVSLLARRRNSLAEP
jgi:hypothetical protein